MAGPNAVAPAERREGYLGQFGVETAGCEGAPNLGTVAPKR